MRPSELGLPHGLVKPSAGQPQGGKGKEPMVVLDPQELERLVQEQQHGGTSVRDLVNGTASSAGVDGDADDEVDLEPQLWEELASAVLGTVPFAFLFAGMCVRLLPLPLPQYHSLTRYLLLDANRDHAVHSQFGESIVPREELRRLANFVPGASAPFPLSRPPGNHTH